MTTDIVARLTALESTAAVSDVTRTPPARPSRAHVKLPQIAVWDSSKRDRDARVFLADVHRHILWYGLPSPQDTLDFLAAHCDDTTRQQLDQVWHRLGAQGVAITWERVEREFLLLTGAAYTRTQEDARRSFIEGRVKQAQGQTVAQYRAHFDAMRARAGGPEAVPEPMAILHFVHGLLPSLARHCSGTHTGEPYPDLEAAFKSARQEEQKLAVDTRASAPVAALPHPPQARTRKRPRGRGGKAYRTDDGAATDGGSAYGGEGAPSKGRGSAGGRGGGGRGGGSQGRGPWRGGGGGRGNGGRGNGGGRGAQAVAPVAPAGIPAIPPGYALVPMAQAPPASQAQAPPPAPQAAWSFHQA
jgi:hypothetical protein